MRTFRALIVTVAAGLLLAGPLSAQQFENVPEAKQAAPAPAGPGGKIAVLNIQVAMANTQEGKKASEDLQARFNPRQSELQKMADEIRDLENQLRTQERTLSDDARADLSRQVETKRKQAQRAQQDLQEDIDAARNDLINRLLGKMEQVITRYARENNLSLILHGGDGGPVIFSTPGVDITSEIVRLYDQTYPLQAAAPPPASKPSQPAPSRKPN